MIIKFIKKIKPEQVYQKRTLIVTQANILNAEGILEVMKVNYLQKRHTINNVLFGYGKSWLLAAKSCRKKISYKGVTQSEMGKEQRLTAEKIYTVINQL